MLDLDGVALVETEQQDRIWPNPCRHLAPTDLFSRLVLACGERMMESADEHGCQVPSSNKWELLWS